MKKLHKKGSKWSISEINACLKIKGYKCLSEIYINLKTKLKFKCDRGHIFYMSWDNLYRLNQNCSECRKENMRGTKHWNSLSFSTIKKWACNNRPGFVLSKREINGNLIIICPANHEYKTKPHNFKNSKSGGCRKCINYKNSKFWKLGYGIYSRYVDKLNFCEEIRRHPEDKRFLQVRCKNSNCRRWFTPNRKEIWYRVSAVNYFGDDLSNFYCSEKCKHSCSVYGQVIYPKGFKKDYNRSDQADWSKMVKERDNYECQRCGSESNLEAHHIEGLNENPIESADIDIGITLCKICHKKAHKEIGCRYVDLKQENICGT